MALLDHLGSQMESGFHTGGLCCSGNRLASSPSLHFSLLSLSGMKMMEIFGIFGTVPHNISKQGYLAEIDWSLIYVSLTLATTLVCTLLIMYPILRRARGMNASPKIIEMLIESSAMYSLSLIVYLALLSKNLDPGYYAAIIAAYVKVSLHRISMWSNVWNFTRSSPQHS